MARAASGTKRARLFARVDQAARRRKSGPTPAGMGVQAAAKASRSPRVVETLVTHMHEGLVGRVRSRALSA